MLIGEGRLFERDAYFEIPENRNSDVSYPFKNKYRPSMLEKYGIFNIDEHI